jgi:poly(3-hydroxybutyrate) depolymerase
MTLFLTVIKCDGISALPTLWIAVTALGNRREYAGCADGARVVHYGLPDGDHDVPYELGDGDTLQVTWEFFKSL